MRTFTMIANVPTSLTSRLNLRHVYFFVMLFTAKSAPSVTASFSVSLLTMRKDAKETTRGFQNVATLTESDPAG